MKVPVLALLAVSVAAQDARFDARSRLVVLPTTVTDAQGRLIDDLDVPDFIVLDNGRPQKVTVDTIGTGVAPIALAIAVQSSGMSAAVLEKVQKAAGMFQPVITGERGCAAVISFSERVTRLQECTNDPQLLARAFRQLRAGEYARARMLDGASAAIGHLTKWPDSRRVLLLISESRDRGSESDLAEVTSAAQAAGVTVYAATYSALKTGFTSRTQVRKQEPKTPRPMIPNPNRTWNGAPPSKYNPLITAPEDRLDVLAAITELKRMHQIETTQVLTGGTGGTTLPFTRQQGLESAIEKLGAELHSQYVLSFVPEESPGGYHTVEVRVVRTGEFRVRVRPGYWRD